MASTARSRHNVAVSVIVVATCWLAGTARADEDLRGRAIELTKAGAAAYGAGRYAEALAKFDEAYRAVPAPPLMMDLSRVHWKLNGCDDAIRYAEMYNAVSPDADAKSWVAEMHTRCIPVTIATQPAGASFAVKGTPLHDLQTPWAGFLPAGEYDVSVRLGGFDDKTASLKVIDGQPGHMDLTLVAHPIVADVSADQFALPPAAPPAPPPPVPAVATPLPPPPTVNLTPPPVAAVPPAVPTPASHVISKLHVAGWVGIVAGGVALATGIALGASSNSDKTNLLGKTAWVSAHADQVSNEMTSIDQRATAANVLFGLGGVLAVGGATMVLAW